MPRNSRQPQTRPEIVPSAEGGVVTINDMRLPQNIVRYVAKDCVSESFQEAYPSAPSRSFRVVAGEPVPDRLIWNITSEPNILIDWQNSYISVLST